ncbi:MAG TPA: carbohydrate kinase family protein [Baekduia sp.]|nr:carbohydrate kinase family protein [Baekduia sp.]
MSAPVPAELTASLRGSTPRIACVGVYIVDILGRPVSELPVGQRALILDEIRMTAAGTGGGTAVDLARLGAEVLAVGAIGSDHAGDFLQAVLHAEGVDVSGLVRRQDVQTSATMLPIHPDGSRPAFHVPGAYTTLAAEDLPWEAIERCDVLHLGGLGALPALDGEPCAAMLRRARAAGLTTTADCLGVKRDDALEVLRPALPHVDLFLPNDGEATEITGEADVEAAARVLHGLGARAVVVTCGGDGAFVVDGDGERWVPAFEAPVVDTTGCGDAFCAGAIVARAAGWPLDLACGLGAATGALNMRGLGSDAGARDLDEALGFMTTAPRRSRAEA